MKQLTKRNYLGEGAYHTFVNEKGEYKNVPCTQEEYDALAQIPPINPTLDGYRWLFSQKGTIKVDTPDSTLGEDEYCDYQGGYYVVSKDTDGNHFAEKVDKKEVVNDRIDETKLKDIAKKAFEADVRK